MAMPEPSTNPVLGTTPTELNNGRPNHKFPRFGLPTHSCDQLTDTDDAYIGFKRGSVIENHARQASVAAGKLLDGTSVIELDLLLRFEQLKRKQTWQQILK